MKKSLVRAFSVLGVLSAILLAPKPAQAVPLVDWTISGPGSLGDSLLGPGNEQLTYYLGYPNFSGDWVVSAVATQDGDYTFDWDYSAFHSWYQATAYLNTFNDGSVTDSTSLFSGGMSGGLNLNGVITFANVLAGETFGFTLGGAHFDSSYTLQGDLTLTQASEVPEPASLLLLGSGLAIGVRRLRKKTA